LQWQDWNIDIKQTNCGQKSHWGCLLKAVFQTSTTEQNSCLYVPGYNFQVFAKGVDADAVVLMAARASRIENQDAIDTAIVGMLADPKEVIDPYGTLFISSGHYLISNFKFNLVI